MKTRLVEIPVCDNCSRDGELYMVTPLSGTGQAVRICKCEKHLLKLVQEASVTNNGSSNGQEPAAEDMPPDEEPEPEEPKPEQPKTGRLFKPLTDLALTLLEKIDQQSGLTFKEYRALMGRSDGSTLGLAPTALAERGLIRIERDGKEGVRYFRTDVAYAE
jgi:hypothetical protein